MKEETYHNKLKTKMDEYAHFLYRISRSLPKEELYGVVSQMRRAALSIILNYLEGYARFKDKSYINFLEISYGSLKETKYLLHFSLKENYINKIDCMNGIKLADEIGAMLWGVISNKKKNI